MRDIIERDRLLDAGYETDNRFPLPDMVDNPAHYTQGDIECIEAIRAALGKAGFIAFCRGNAIKYLWRLLDKHEDGLVDAQKASKYLQWIKEELDAE